MYTYKYYTEYILYIFNTNTTYWDIMYLYCINYYYIDRFKIIIIM